MRNRRAVLACSLLVTAAVLGASPDAQAQEDGLAIDRLYPSHAGDRMFGVDSPYVAGESALHLRLQTDYASNSLALFKKLGRGESFEVVSSQIYMRLNGTLSLWDRLNVNIDIPVAVSQSGSDQTIEGQTFVAPDSAAFGDVRLGLRGRLYGELRDPFQVGLGAYFWLPTGEVGADSYVTDGSVRALPQLLLGGELDFAVWSFNFGADIRESQTYAGVAQGTMLRWAGGMGVLLGDDKQVQLGPEFSAAITVDDVRRKNTNAEILLGARYRFVEPFEVGAAAGPGLTPGYGTPDARVIGMISYTPSTARPPSDRDHDGFNDKEDACPDVPAPAGYMAGKGCPPPPDRDEDSVIDSADACPDIPGIASDKPEKNGCPSDRDDDGLIDTEDACPDEPADKSANPLKPGCPAPPDGDGDGVADPVDACPAVPGNASTNPEDNGCPPDTDGDSIRDHEDACPDEKGQPNADKAKNGCPSAVVVTDDEIVITQQVQFETGTAAIKAESDGLLSEVASVLNEHPEIKKLEVQGHTDDRGSKALNTKLSGDRASAVLDALAARGVEKSRLSSKGYGSDTPIADNTTDEGRAKNRRVQFKIIEREEQK